MTGIEREQLNSLRLELNELLSMAADQVRDELAELGSHIARPGLEALQRDTASLLRELLIARGLRELDLTDRYNRLVSEHNSIVDRIKARDRAEAERRQAIKERELLRSQLCPQCFTVHAGECF
jgi:DNA-binding GntR family transcriptional regulator